MARGRQTRTLTLDQRSRLERFRRASHDGAPHGYSLPLLRTAMQIGCSWETLQKALLGLPVWDLHHSAIVAWIERYLPVSTPVHDGKAAAAGEREEENGENGEAARTIRGSR
jgi:hypothetical protein